MSLLTWLSTSSSEKSKEIKEQKKQLSMSVMQMERRASEVRQLADDVMKFMHRKDSNEKN